MFVEGAATFLVVIGIPLAAAKVLVAVMVISFAATSLDTGVRIQRFIIAELGQAWRISLLRNRYVGSGIAVVLPLLLYLAGKEKTLWPLFGAANQMLAGLSLIVVSVWLYQKRRPWAYAAIPMAIVLVIAAAALVSKAQSLLVSGHYTLVVVACVLLVLEVWMLAEGAAAVVRSRRGAELAA
jgi:carbon starvation protein